MSETDMSGFIGNEMETKFISYQRTKHPRKHPNEFTVEKTERGYWIRRKSGKVFIPFFMLGVFCRILKIIEEDWHENGTRNAGYLRTVEQFNGRS